MPANDITDQAQRDRNDAAAERIRQIWALALKDVLAQVRAAEDAMEEGNYTAAVMRSILNDLQAGMKGTVQEASDLMKEELGGALDDEVKEIQSEASKLLEGKPSLDNFAGVSRDIIGILGDQLASGADQAAERANRVGTDYTDALRQLQLESLAYGELTSQSIEEHAAAIKKGLAEGRAKIPEGWKGSVESYAEMVARTNIAEATRALTLAQAADYGIEIFQVSVHGAADACGAFEGRLVSNDGKGEGVSMSVGELYSMRPLIFHPNCLHRLNPWTDSLASADRKRAVEIANSVPFPSDEEMKKMNSNAAKLRRQGEEDQTAALRDEEKRLARQRLGRAK